jgi:predicted glycoside hydrolase/deacetylase ChbG (UPF0249 family)
MVTGRFLIVNADDLGMSEAVNRGIARAHTCGIVTSASLMVLRPAAEEAVEYARRHREMSLGLHLDLEEWECRDGRWQPVYVRVPPDDAARLEEELDHQLAAFRRLVGTDPTHIDSHQHVHRSEPLRGLTLERAQELRIPLRGCDPSVAYCGDFYGQTRTGLAFPQGIALQRLLDILATLPAGVTELGCHPGEAGSESGDYSTEREAEITVLCDPRVLGALEQEDISLCSFHDAPLAAVESGVA